MDRLSSLQAVALPQTQAEWMALYEALGQYVENEECAEDEGAASSTLAAARAVRDRFDAAIAALAR